MAQPVRVEMGARESILAIGFVMIVLIAVALAQAGVITNPVSLGLIITMTIGLMLVGHVLVTLGFLSRGAIPLWYMFVFGIIMLSYGFVYSGALPAAVMAPSATLMEIALTSALLYTLLFVGITAAVIAVYMYYKRKMEEARLGL